MINQNYLLHIFATTNKDSNEKKKHLISNFSMRHLLNIYHKTKLMITHVTNTAVINMKWRKCKNFLGH